VQTDRHKSGNLKNPKNPQSKCQKAADAVFFELLRDHISR
jgi:hypothetical protein